MASSLALAATSISQVGKLMDQVPIMRSQSLEECEKVRLGNEGREKIRREDVEGYDMKVGACTSLVIGARSYRKHDFLVSRSYSASF